MFLKNFFILIALKKGCVFEDTPLKLVTYLLKFSISSSLNQPPQDEQ